MRIVGGKRKLQCVYAEVRPLNSPTDCDELICDLRNIFFDVGMAFKERFGMEDARNKS